MEVRKVQLTGGSSYVMTLPKEWIKSSNIKKNDPLGIKLQSDGTLLITPKMTTETIYKIKKINCDKIEKISYLYRRLIASYIAGFNTIHVFSDKRITPEVRSTVRVFSQTAIGQEIVEETDKYIIIKDLLNPVEMPFNKTIKRMHIIVKGMYEDSILAIKTPAQNIDNIKMPISIGFRVLVVKRYFQNRIIKKRIDAPIPKKAP